MLTWAKAQKKPSPSFEGSTSATLSSRNPQVQSAVAPWPFLIVNLWLGFSSVRSEVLQIGQDAPDTMSTSNAAAIAAK
jgi:hypothetical protein